MTKDKFFELKIALTEYISKYGIYYSPELLKKLQENFIASYEYKGYTKCYLMEAYEECGLSEGLYKNSYGAFIKHMKEDCDINSDLLEVGCGIIPSLAKS